MAIDCESELADVAARHAEQLDLAVKGAEEADVVHRYSSFRGQAGPLFASAPAPTQGAKSGEGAKQRAAPLAPTASYSASSITA